MRSYAVASLMVLLVSGAATTAKSQTGPLGARPNIGAVCQRIMRIHKIDIADFRGCITSLSKSYASGGGYVRTGDEEFCKSKGLNERTAGMATCMLNREYEVVPVSAFDHMEAQIEQVAASDPDKESYFGTPPSVVTRREQYACAQLGLDPASVAFHACVNNLDSTLYAIDHPPGSG